MTPRRARALIVMAASAGLAAGSNLLLRHAMGSLGGGDALTLFLEAVVTPAIIAGIAGYALSQLLWLNVLTEARLGAAFPVFVSTTFVIVMAGAVVLLGESLTSTRIGGAVLVAAGIVVAEWTGRGRSDSGEVAAGGER